MLDQPKKNLCGWVDVFNYMLRQARTAREVLATGSALLGRSSPPSFSVPFIVRKVDANNLSE